jgi:cellulose synthase operon protein C
MEKVNRNLRAKFLMFSAAMLLTVSTGLHGQTAAEKALLAKAQSLASSGQPGLAAQVWQQVLLVDANNLEALKGLARAYSQMGQSSEAKKYLDRLRAAGVSQQEIAAIESSTRTAEPAKLSDAEELARRGDNAGAMRIYRELYGSNPPAGPVALSYYWTEAGIPADRAHALEGLRRLATQFQADSKYPIALGTVLTYDPKTRDEGMSILRKYKQSSSAQQALNQAEKWNAGSAAGAQGTQQESVARATPSPAQATPSAVASAYRSLNAGKLKDAERQFQAILEKQPNDPDTLAGMAYVHMKQQDFATADEYLKLAQAAGAKGLAKTQSTNSFWITMGKAGDLLKEGDSNGAIKAYREAVAMNPGSVDALSGLGAALEVNGEHAEAIEVLSQAVKLGPQRTEGWRGLFLAQSGAGNAEEALDTNDRMPKAVQRQLESEPDYLQTLAKDYLAVGRKPEADLVIEKALALPFPNQGRDMPPQRQMQYAGLLMMAQKYEPAIRLYRQVVEANPQNADAWKALIAAQHQLKRDDDALATVGKMPQALLEKEQNDPAFLVLMGSIYQSQGNLPRAEKYLERAVATNPPNSSNVEMQLADVYAVAGDAQKAYEIYHRELLRNPQSGRAWQGTLDCLHRMNQDRTALSQMANMPDIVRLRLEQDPGYLQTLASIQVAAGQSQAALRSFSNLIRIYEEQNLPVPVGAQIQLGWLLLKIRDDQKLYTLISNLSNSDQMTDAQRSDFNQLWAIWSIQRANSAVDPQKGLVILEAAAQAFPNNADVHNALAGAYLKAGDAKHALAVYQSLDMTNASVGQYQGALAAALSAGDLTQAQSWLEVALQRYQSDPAILKMAAQYEQTRGDSGKAAAYYRAALAAMGPAPFGGLSAPGALAPATTPTQQLMDLLAPPPSPVSRSQIPAEPGTDDRRLNLSWQEAPGPGQRGATLGDYVQSYAGQSAGGRSAVAVSNLGDFAEANPRSRNWEAVSDTPLPAIATVRGPDSNASDGFSSRDYAEAGSADSPPTQAAQFASIVVKAASSPPVTVSESRNATLLQPVSAPTKTMSPISVRPMVSSAPMSSQMGQNPLQGLTSQSPVTTDVYPAPKTPPALIEQAELPVLPPLSGRPARVVRQKTEREQVEDQLAVLEGARSPWLGGSGGVIYRSGQPGYNKLANFSVPLESSWMMGPNVRATAVMLPVILDSGQPVVSPTYRQGTLGPDQVPTIQTAAAIGGEFQLRAPSFAGSLGYSGHGFLVPNVIGDLYIHPPGSHYTLNFGRDPVMETQLSYAGLRDQASRGPGYPGNSWGGVVSNSGELQLAFGNDRSGWYIQGGAQYLTGKHVQDNVRVDGDAGAYWGVWRHPQYGSLQIGTNFFGMHYSHNLSYFTYGQGGYFSPAAYMLAGVPVTFAGHHGARFHYRATGSIGVQAFTEDRTPYFPLDPAIQAGNNYPYYPDQTVVAGNYSLAAEGAYVVGQNWYVGGYLNFNNTRNFATETVGFYVRYLFRPQPALRESGPTGLFPVEGLRPLGIP